MFIHSVKHKMIDNKTFKQIVAAAAVMRYRYVHQYLRTHVRTNVNSNDCT